MNVKSIKKAVLELFDSADGEKKKFDDENSDKTGGGAQARGAAKENLYKKLEKIDEDYAKEDKRTYDGKVLPKYEKKTYDAPSDEEIADAAKQAEKSVTAEKKRLAEKEADDKIAVVKDKIADVNAAVNESGKRINDAYAQAKTNAAAEAVKRGIARSSIVAEQLRSLDEGKIDRLEKVYGDGRRQTDELNDEIERLNKSMSDALKKYDVEEAIKINERIITLKNEREKTKNEIAAYNNALQDKRNKVLNELGARGIEVTEENSDEYKNARVAKIRALYDYYKNSPDALAELAQDKNIVERYVGNDGYEYLVRNFK